MNKTASRARNKSPRPLIPSGYRTATTLTRPSRAIRTSKSKPRTQQPNFGAARRHFHSESPQPLDLVGKTAIVSGGSRGIGLAATKLLLSRGANVIYCSKSSSSVDAAQAEITRAFPGFRQHPNESPATATNPAAPAVTPFQTPVYSLNGAPTLAGQHQQQLRQGLPLRQFFQGFECDVGSEQSIQAFFAATKTLKTNPALTQPQPQHSEQALPAKPLFTGADILVNCAGICQNQLLLRTVEAAIADVMKVNVNGTMLMTKHFLKQLPIFPAPQSLPTSNTAPVEPVPGEEPASTSVSNPQPDQRQQQQQPLQSPLYTTQINIPNYYRVINISSVVGKQGNPGQSVYATSKAAVDGFTRSMSKEMYQYRSSPITFNSIAPGFIETDMTSIMTADQLNKIVDRVGLRRIGQPEEIANLIGFLASNQSSYINGQNISADGGM